MIEFNLEENSIEIGTNSAFGSGDLLRVVFFAEDGTSLAGNLKIKFDRSPKYSVDYCTGRWEKLALKPSARRSHRIWRLTEAEDEVVVRCNGDVVIRIRIRNHPSPTCRKMWAQDAEYMKFLDGDSASLLYRAVEGGGI